MNNKFEKYQCGLFGFLWMSMLSYRLVELCALTFLTANLSHTDPLELLLVEVSLKDLQKVHIQHLIHWNGPRSHQLPIKNFLSKELLQWPFKFFALVKLIIV